MRGLLRKLPEPLRLLFHRISWFFRNYEQIQSDSTLFHAVHGPARYNTDGLCTSNNADFQFEPRFAKAYAAAKATNPWPEFTLQWRIHVVCILAEYASQLEGEFVECGVNTGSYARAILDYLSLDQLNKRFWLFDTFNGLVPSQVSEAEMRAGIDQYFSTYIDVYDSVVKTFAGFPCKIVKGAVPETLPQYDGKPVCFLSIDMNCVAPEIAALDFFWDKLVPGAVILLDDYGFPVHIEQKLAFDRFAANKNVPLLCLPTGQALMWKPQIKPAQS